MTSVELIEAWLGGPHSTWYRVCFSFDASGAQPGFSVFLACFILA